MKLYYDSDGAPTWVEVTDIITLPVPKIRIDEPSIVIAEIRDFQGALYSTWSSRDFTAMKITDGAGAPTTLFRGFISGKRFLHNKTTLSISGFSKKLESTPLNNNYIIEQGKVSDVPASIAGAESNLLAEGDAATQWNLIQEDTHWEALDEYTPGFITLSGNMAAKVDEFDMDTLVAADVTNVRIYLNGLRMAIVGSPPSAPEVDIFMNGGWIGYQTVAIPYDINPAWAYTDFAGAWNQADLTAMKVRIKGTTVANQWINVYQMYAKITYTGLDAAAIALEDLEDPPEAFEWDVDKWITNNDVGILIVDNSKNNDEANWECTGIATNNGTYIDGNCNSLDDPDGIEYHAREGDLTTKMDITPVIGGANINTGLYIQKITIKYKYSIKADALGPCHVHLKILKDAAWDIISYGPHTAPINNWYSTGDCVYEVPESSNAELLKYLTVDGVNYDELKGIKFEVSEFTTQFVEVKIDYLVADIEYLAYDINPIMEQIDDNGASWVKVTGIDWFEEGVRVGDSFKIGENTTQILTDISTASGVAINVQSTLTKYIAQWFRGTYAIEVIKKICLLEGLHWWEDHTTTPPSVVLSAETDFVDSTVDLTQANYDFDWEFEDDSNFYKEVEVFGAAALGIHYKARDNAASNTSTLTKTFIEETILTIPEAKEIAETQLLEYKVKRPSIKIPLDGVNALLGVGKTVTLTMVRPTVAEADYPIRMIERTEREPDGIKTIIWCGLGHSTWEENLADVINKAMYLAHKAHTDRLVSTPAGEGAVITWSQIGGAGSGVRTIIDSELVEGQSIDDRIDTLIAATYTNAEIDALIAALDYYTQAAVDALLHTRLHSIVNALDHSANTWNVFYSNGAGALVELALGADGTVLTSTGAASAPAFETGSGHTHAAKTKTNGCVMLQGTGASSGGWWVMNGNGETCQVGISVRDDVDETEDILFKIQLRCASADATLAFTKYASAVKLGEAHSWNIYNNVANNMSSPVAMRLVENTITIAAANIEQGDDVAVAWKLNEGSRTVYVHNVTIQYTEK